MKKIIEHGYRQYMETLCPYCGCRFSYEWEDVIYKASPYMYWTEKMHTVSNCNWTISVPKYEIVCPECNTKFEILNWNFHNFPKSNDITWTVKTSIEEEKKTEKEGDSFEW